LPKNENIGKPGNAFDIPQAIRDNATQLQFNSFDYGYAFSSTGKTQKASILSLLLYVVAVIIHIATSLITGMSTSKWGSPSEIVALALTSMPPNLPAELKNTGAGIETIALYEQKIELGEKRGTLILGFQEDLLSHPAKPIPDEQYG
jgi:hypothetical protein